jgi:hypothetical protein
MILECENVFLVPTSLKYMLQPAYFGSMCLQLWGRADPGVARNESSVVVTRSNDGGLQTTRAPSIVDDPDFLQPSATRRRRRRLSSNTLFVCLSERSLLQSLSMAARRKNKSPQQAKTAPPQAAVVVKATDAVVPTTVAVTHLPPLALVVCVLVCSGFLAVLGLRDYWTTGKNFLGDMDEKLLVGLSMSMAWRS